MHHKHTLKCFQYPNPTLSVSTCILAAANLTTGTIYEVAVWAQTSVGDSPTALSRQQTTGTQPEPPLLKARALNQSSVDCSWTVTGSPAQVTRVQHDSYCITDMGHVHLVTQRKTSYNVFLTRKQK